MSELDRDARALIARARRTEGPSREDRARLRARLEPIWAAHRAQQSFGSGATQLAGGPVRGLWGRGSTWLHSLLLTALLLWGPEAAPELRTPVPDAPEPVQSRSETAALERAGQPPMAAEEALGAHSASELAVVDAASARPARPFGAAQREPTQAVPAPPPHAATDARARATRGEVVGRVASAAAPRSAASQLRAEPKLDRQAAAMPAPPEHLPLDPRAERELASRERASSAAQARAGKAELAEPRERGPVRRDPGFAPQAIDDELGWLAAAQQALREGRAEQALRLVQEHAFRFPRGALAPERIAVQALALCALDRRSAARAVLADLARTAPGSPLLQGVQRKCGDGL